MSLPPQVLKIKRKRIDDPVDSLCTCHASSFGSVENADKTAVLGPHDAQQQSKRRTTEHSYVFRRLSITQEVQRPAPAQPSGIPLIRTTLPGEENRYFDKVARHTRNQEMAAGEVTETRTATEPSDTTHAEERSPVIPIRLFRLARIGLDAHAAQLESPGARQPIFVEKPTSETKDRDLRSGVNSAVSGVKPTRDEEPITLQKRPSGHAPNFGHKRKDMQREEEKPDIEMEEAMRQMAADLELEQQSQVVNQVQSAQVDMNMTDVTDEANYVYDTYIRDEVPRIVGSTSMDTMTGSRDKGGVGYLVIEDGDQDLWETYVERSDESDPDWDSEQDDENGKPSCFDSATCD